MTALFRLGAIRSVFYSRQTIFEIANSSTDAGSARSEAHWDLMRQATEARLKHENVKVEVLRNQLSDLVREAVAPMR